MDGSSFLISSIVKSYLLYVEKHQELLFIHLFIRYILSIAEQRVIGDSDILHIPNPSSWTLPVSPHKLIVHFSKRHSTCRQHFFRHLLYELTGFQRLFCIPLLCWLLFNQEINADMDPIGQKVHQVLGR